ncbi:hypothetical protein HY249_02960 [Candidatus Azambacteria bacterium]|nr:hypothetical protein [Candidatus Azambacteria bacterium]
MLYVNFDQDDSSVSLHVPKENVRAVLGLIKILMINDVSTKDLQELVEKNSDLPLDIKFEASSHKFAMSLIDRILETSKQTGIDTACLKGFVDLLDMDPETARMH